MRNWIFAGLVLILLVFFGWNFMRTNEEKPTVAPKNNLQTSTTTMALTITSPAFMTNGTIPSLYTCDGENISPELDFANIPSGTQSLALTMEDPDVPTSIRPDGMWNHWVIWNIPPTTIHINENDTPPGVAGRNTGGKAAYGGPCPPDREHRYFFTLYALNTMLNLPQGATKEELLSAAGGHVIEKSVLVGRYNRN